MWTHLLIDPHMHAWLHDYTTLPLLRDSLCNIFGKRSSDLVATKHLHATLAILCKKIESKENNIIIYLLRDPYHKTTVSLLSDHQISFSLQANDTLSRRKYHRIPSSSRFIALYTQVCKKAWGKSCSVATSGSLQL